MPRKRPIRDAGEAVDAAADAFKELIKRLMTRGLDIEVNPFGGLSGKLIDALPFLKNWKPSLSLKIPPKK